MIALCKKHHDMADGGAYTKDQLHKLKQQGRAGARERKGRFEWMRQRLLCVAGGNFFYETGIPIQFLDIPIIWFNRDEEGHFLLNVNMLSASGEPRALIRDNYWWSLINVSDLICPPSGKRLSLKYDNGDALKIKFFELTSFKSFTKKYAYTKKYIKRWNGGKSLEFPLTAVDIQMEVANTPIYFGPSITRISKLYARGILVTRARIGIHYNGDIFEFGIP